MTEEEFFIKNYPDSCYGNKPLSPHWDFFQDGVEFGERKSEKQIEIDAKHIIALQKQNGELTDKCRMLEDKLANADYQLEGRDLEIKELEAQIEKMKQDLDSARENANRQEQWEIYSVLNGIYNDNFEVITSVSN